jgi:acetyltransferase-like isoleucine patch superfamily enzyme
MSIHPTAIVSPKARLGVGVSVGAFSIIRDNVALGDDSNVGPFCDLGFGQSETLFIGSDSIIRSHSIIYGGTKIGRNFASGHHVTIRENSLIGEHFQIGTYGDIQGHCRIGNFTKFHSNVHIGQHADIGNHVWIFPFCVLTNDPHPPSEVQIGVVINDFAVIATMSVLLPGVNIGEGALVGASSLVNKNVPKDQIALGNPIKVLGPTSKILLKDGSLKPAYPWRRHFHRNYPEEMISLWKEEFKDSDY